MRRVTPMVLVTAALAVVAGCGDALWHRGSFESALSLAGSRNTLVMLEFQTDW